MGECVGKGDYPHYIPQGMGGWDAHTHLCADDKHFHFVCISLYRYIKNSDDTPTDLLWHEYAHVLDKTTVLNCSEIGVKYNTLEDIQVLGHGPTFIEICNKLGKPEISGRIVKPPY